MFKHLLHSFLLQGVQPAVYNLSDYDDDDDDDNDNDDKDDTDEDDNDGRARKTLYIESVDDDVTDNNHWC